MVDMLLDMDVIMNENWWSCMRTGDHSFSATLPVLCWAMNGSDWMVNGSLSGHLLPYLWRSLCRSILSYMQMHRTGSFPIVTTREHTSAVTSSWTTHYFSSFLHSHRPAPPVMPLHNNMGVHHNIRRHSIQWAMRAHIQELLAIAYYLGKEVWMFSVVWYSLIPGEAPWLFQF